MNQTIMEDDLPLKLIELSDFLRSPSILSKRLSFKETKLQENLPSNKVEQGKKGKENLPGIILLTQKAISNEVNQPIQKELIVSNDVIIFADDVDRKKLGILQKSNHFFSR